ncbi:protein singed wings 2-like [Daphnia carinata]|uniref:protein singed wings 2-like n=1 Tax=Daphnia carinata TaxID=120202 RepID=UPI00257F2E1D|nr:protein singed wings 2-like [Daphnia carinata]
MSLRKSCLIFCSTVWLCVLCIQPSSSYCPDICQCYNNYLEETVWNCTHLVSVSQLWSDGRLPLYGDFQQPDYVQHLHVRDSKLDFSENLLPLFPNLKTLELSHNLINCSKHLVWLLQLSDKLYEPENIHCTSPQTFNGTQVLKALQLIYDVGSRCPERCVCELAHVPKDDQYVTVSVSCNNLGFTEIPKILPANVTIHMDLSNNRIEDVSELAKNPSYSRVTVLYLANNRIQSITSLENSDWIEQFSLLSLQGNLLQEIPTQALSNVFHHQDINGVRMLLSNNPWKCDCVTITRFQPFIAKHKQLIKDVSNVTCGPEEGESAGKKIISVELSSVCGTNGNNAINLMDVLNVFLALLTLVTIGKLLYDYYAYRKTGRLPWIASKLP